MNKLITNKCYVSNDLAARGKITIWSILIALVLLSGCTGLQTFSQAVLPGDTVSLAIHRQMDIKRSDATIYITDFNSTVHTIPGTDLAVRGWVNAYVDPLSKIVVGQQTNREYGVAASTLGFTIDGETGFDKDWFETTVFLDLPTNLASGISTIDIEVGGSSILPQPVSVNVLPLPAGPPHLFSTAEGFDLDFALLGMERAGHRNVVFSGATIPAAVQVDLIHAADRENGGGATDQAYAVHPRGDIKSISWSDDGTNMRVIITPAWHKTTEDINGTSSAFNPDSIEAFNFYVAGLNLNSFEITSVTAYDSDGVPVTGVMAVIE